MNQPVKKKVSKECRIILWDGKKAAAYCIQDKKVSHEHLPPKEALKLKLAKPI